MSYLYKNLIRNFSFAFAKLTNYLEQKRDTSNRRSRFLAINYSGLHVERKVGLPVLKGARRYGFLLYRRFSAIYFIALYFVERRHTYDDDFLTPWLTPILIRMCVHQKHPFNRAFISDAD